MPARADYLEYNSTMSCSLMFSGTFSLSGYTTNVPVSAFSLKSTHPIFWIFRSHQSFKVFALLALTCNRDDIHQVSVEKKEYSQPHHLP